LVEKRKAGKFAVLGIGTNLGKIGKGALVKRTRWLGLLLLLTLPLPLAMATGWRKDSPDLVAVNRRLSGKVIDYTANHGVDNRIWSPHLYQRRDLYVYLPPEYDPSKCYPFMIFLHGSAQDEQSFLHHVAPRVDQAIRYGKLPPLIIAAPDGSCSGEPSLHDSGSFFINSRMGDFEDFVLQDVWDFVCQHYPIRPEREAHILAGLSMGGFAAYNYAIKHREAFGVVIGVYPPLNLRWMDASGNYMANFDPHNWGWRQELGERREIVGRFAGGLVKVGIEHFVGPVFGDGPEAVLLLSQENPIEMLARYNVMPGDLQMYVAYGGKDQFNIDAQVESFLYVARYRGLEVGVGYDPKGGHTLVTAGKLFDGILDWLAERIAQFSPEDQELEEGADNVACEPE
jgi:S-formylglutathione hydrolase FrmB